MICPESNEIEIARRILAMADRLGHSAIPEEIANEARSALFDLSGIEGGNLKIRATQLAHRLISYAGTEGRSARPASRFEVGHVAENLRAAIAFEELHIPETGREAA